MNFDADTVQNQQIWIWNTSLKLIQIWKHAYQSMKVWTVDRILLIFSVTMVLT